MSIQQALNNMLMSAQFGAGLYAHSPAGQEYFQQKQEDKTETSIEQAIKELQKQYAEGLDEKTTPQEHEMIKRVYERNKTLKQTQFERDPEKYGFDYDMAVFNLGMVEKDNLRGLGFERTALAKLKEKTDTKSEQKYAFHSRFKTLKEGVKTAHTRTTNQEKWRKRALPGGDE